jgi:peptide/nickel transport system ATP-binding protein
MMAMTEPVLVIKNLSVVLSREGRTFRVLDEIGFSVAPGEIVALVGESGSGKSTIGLALQGLLPQDSRPRVTGSIRVAGTELVGAPGRVLRMARRQLVRAISQDPMGALNPTMTIRRQLQESTGADDQVIEDWLRRTGLFDPGRIAGSLPHRLSGGQCQRVLIAMSMMARPKLLIADEPTTALDVTTQAQFLYLLRNLARAQQTAVLFVTHDLNFAVSLADRMLVLYGGRIVEIGTVADVSGNPAHPYTAGLLAARFDFDSDRTRPLSTLPERQGDADAAYGCTFAPRCTMARADCRAIRPPLRSAPGHPGAVACLHAEELPLHTTQSSVAKPWPVRAIAGAAVALQLSGVSKSFGSGRKFLWRRRRPVSVLRSIDLTIKLGECVALVGESGAGKTTILRMAAGLLSPDSGNVFRIDVVPPQLVYQDPVSALTPWLSIGEQIGERLRVFRIDPGMRRRLVCEALELVGLGRGVMHALPRELSVGQCQRAVIARAVVVPPKVLLCDEPLSALDVSLAATTLNLLGDIRRRLGMAMLFVTHDLAAARIVADRIAVLQFGELVEDGDPDTLILAPTQAYTRSLIAAMPPLHGGNRRSAACRP